MWSKLVIVVSLSQTSRLVLLALWLRCLIQKEVVRGSRACSLVQIAAASGLKGYLATGLAVKVFGDDGPTIGYLILIVLQVVHLYLADVSTCDSPIGAIRLLQAHSDDRISVLLRVLSAWIRDQICHSEHLGLVSSMP